ITPSPLVRIRRLWLRCKTRADAWAGINRPCLGRSISPAATIRSDGNSAFAVARIDQRGASVGGNVCRPSGLGPVLEIGGNGALKLRWRAACRGEALLGKFSDEIGIAQ